VTEKIDVIARLVRRDAPSRRAAGWGRTRREQEERRMRLALLTFGLLRAVPTDPAVEGFVALTDPAFAQAESSDGFLGLFGHQGVGRHRRPERWQGLEYAGRCVIVRSLWRDLDSVLAFAVTGHHGEALRRSREWIVPGDWPGSVAWWVEDDEVPTVADALSRYDRLDREGSSAAAFSLREPYDERGEPVRVTRP
jgi:hypothetical protein